MKPQGAELIFSLVIGILFAAAIAVLAIKSAINLYKSIKKINKL